MQSQSHDSFGGKAAQRLSDATPADTKLAYEVSFDQALSGNVTPVVKTADDGLEYNIWGTLTPLGRLSVAALKCGERRNGTLRATCCRPT